jgi:hypothetical protein
MLLDECNFGLYWPNGSSYLAFFMCVCLKMVRNEKH